MADLLETIDSRTHRTGKNRLQSLLFHVDDKQRESLQRSFEEAGQPCSSF